MIRTVCKIYSSIFNIKPKIFQIRKIFSGFYGGIVFIPFLLMITGFYFDPFTAAHAATARTNSISEFNNAIANADPGDTIILTDGRYDTSSTTIRFSANGTAGNEVVITAETPGDVIFTGPKTYADVTGSYQIIHGFHFKDIDTSGNWNTLVMRFMGASHNRVTNCKFENIGQGGGSTLIGVEGNSPHNRFDHNTWDGNDGVGIETPLSSGDRRNSTHTRIYHNVFKNHAKDDASEALRLGRGASSALVKAYMTIEYNLFEEYNGDPETFSVKSSNNTIRYNVVRNCNGGMKLRQGDNNTLDSNYWILEDDRAWADYGLATGIKIKGSGHKVINNYIYRPRIGISVENSSFLSYRGTVTSKPTEAAPYFLIDANATWSNDQYNGKYVWITSGGGEGKAYKIKDTDATNKRLHCVVSAKDSSNVNIRSDGVTAGSTYTINTGSPEVRNLKLINNTIIGNQRNGIQIGGTTKSSIVKNNLINTDANSDLYSGINEYNGATISYEANLFYSSGDMNAWKGAGGQPAGIIEGNQNLTFDGKIYRLQSSSSNAIDKGLSDTYVTKDIDEQLRDPFAVDIGADEFTTESNIRAMISEGIGGAGVQWPQSTLINSLIDTSNELEAPSGLRVVK